MSGGAGERISMRLAGNLPISTNNVYLIEKAKPPPGEIQERLKSFSKSMEPLAAFDSTVKRMTQRNNGYCFPPIGTEVMHLKFERTCLLDED